MEKSIIIIGNGFDLQCDLKSDYGSFYNDCKLKNTNFYEYIRVELLGKTKYNQHSSYTIDYEESFYKSRDFVNERLQDIDLNNVNSWEVILTVLCSKQFKNLENIFWKDIEKYISDFVTNSDNKNEININNLGTAFIKIRNHEPIVEKDLILYKLAFTIFKIFNSEDSDLIFNMSKLYFDKYLVSKDVYDLYRFLLNELNRLEYKLGIYLECIYSKNRNIYERKAEQLFNLIIGSLKEDAKKYIMSFNYTLPKVKISNLNGVNVHGSIEDLDKYKLNSIIIGIDQDKIKSSDFAYMFTKTYRKMYLSTNLNSQPLPKNIAQSPVSNIFIYGHSLSEADYSYYFSLFDFYSIYSSDVKVNFIFTVYKEVERDIIEHRLFLDITKLFNVYIDRMTNKNQLKNLQHKLLLEQRLIVKEIPSIE